MTKQEHTGLRVIQYYDKVVKYPYLPGARRGDGFFDGEKWVSAEKKAENRRKVEAARYRYARQMISDTVKVMARNGGIFFTVTSAGVENVPPRKISELIDYMRKKHGLLYYTWVRENTKSGLPHWHFAAVFTRRGLSAVQYFKKGGLIVKISDYWSRLIGGKECGNSIRLGWCYRDGKAQRYILNYDAAGYLVKYLMKGNEGQKKGTRKWSTNLDYLRPRRFDIVKEYSFAVIPTKSTIKAVPVESDALFFLAKYHILPNFDIRTTARASKIVGNASYWAQIFYIKSPKIDLRALKKYTDSLCN